MKRTLILSLTISLLFQASVLAAPQSSGWTSTTNAAEARAALGLPQTVTNTLWLDIRDFGAVSDPLGDDTAAIQAALDYATNGPSAPYMFSRATVYIPAGYWLVSDSLRIRASGTRVLGESMSRTIIKMYPEKNKPVFIKDIWAGDVISPTCLYYCGFEKFTVVNWDYPPTVAATSAAFCFTNTPSAPIVTAISRSSFKDVSINWFYYGIYISGSVGVTYDNVQASYNNTGFYIEKGDSQIFRNCFVGHARNYDDPNRTNRFNAPASFGYVFTNSNFATVVNGGEAAYVDTVFDIADGQIFIQGVNVEAIYRPAIDVHGSVSACVVDSCRFFGLQTTNPAVKFASGTANTGFLRQNVFVAPTYPPIEVNKEGEIPGYSGPIKALLTNIADNTSILLPLISYTNNQTIISNLSMTGPLANVLTNDRNVATRLLNTLTLSNATGGSTYELILGSSGNSEIAFYGPAAGASGVLVWNGTPYVQVGFLGQGTYFPKDLLGNVSVSVGTSTQPFKEARVSNLVALASVSIGSNGIPAMAIGNGGLEIWGDGASKRAASISSNGLAYLRRSLLITNAFADSSDIRFDPISSDSYVMRYRSNNFTKLSVDRTGYLWADKIRDGGNVFRVTNWFVNVPAGQTNANFTVVLGASLPQNLYSIEAHISCTNFTAFGATSIDITPHWTYNGEDYGPGFEDYFQPGGTEDTAMRINTGPFIIDGGSTITFDVVCADTTIVDAAGTIVIVLIRYPHIF